MWRVLLVISNGNPAYAIYCYENFQMFLPKEVELLPLATLYLSALEI